MSCSGCSCERRVPSTCLLSTGGEGGGGLEGGVVPGAREKSLHNRGSDSNPLGLESKVVKICCHSWTWRDTLWHKFKITVHYFYLSPHMTLYQVSSCSCDTDEIPANVRCCNNVGPAGPTLIQRWIIACVWNMQTLLHTALTLTCITWYGGTPANTRHSHNAVSMLGHRLRRWTNIETALIVCLVFSGTGMIAVQYITRCPIQLPPR